MCAGWIAVLLLRYQHICDACDEMKAEKAADLFRLLRLAIEFEGVRTIPTEELSRGKVSGLLSPLIQRLGCMQSQQFIKFGTISCTR